MRTPFKKSYPLLGLFIFACAGLALASDSPASAPPPKGLAASDWSSIRAAYEAGRHAAHRQQNGVLTARNPGQQWRTDFDGKGFTVTPDHGQWTWGLELTAYGERTLLSAPFSLTHDGGKISCQRDENLTEWFINDTRGLEQGWTISSRSVGVSPTSSPLTLTLALRGDLKPQVSPDSSSVSFQTASGGTALSYGGLKAWDADGKNLNVRFEDAGENAIRIAVEDQNARYPITIDPIAQQAYLKASNSGASDQFGYSVAISGDTVVVGARFESSNATGTNGNQADNSAGTAGAAYIFIRSGSTWSQQAYLKASNTGVGDSFGESVAISGDTVVIGAYREDSNATGVNGNQANNSWPDSGAAYIFTRSGGIWTQQAYLKASNNGVDYNQNGSGDYFGYAVAVSGDTVAVGAWNESSDANGVNGNQSNNNALGSGACYVFTRSGSSWSQQAYLKAGNTGSQDQFGFSVALHDETLIVGATGESSNATGVNGDQSNNSASASGAAYVFTCSGGTWSQQAYLKASNTEAFDSFGCSVAISGNTVAVGAAREDSTATGVNGGGVDIANYDSGAAYVFARVGTAWSQQAYLKASDTGVPSLGGSSPLVDTDDAFGRSIAIWGDTIVVGEPGEDSGATGVDSNYSNINKTNTGAAYVFIRSGEVWNQVSYIKDNYAGFFSVDDHFGWSVAISGETMIVGSPYEASSATGVNGNEADDSAYRSGAAYIHTIRFPEIAIEQAGSDIANSTTTAFGTVVTGSTSDLIFTILNTGPADLTLSGTPKVAVSGSSDFIVTAQPTSPITGPSGSTTFTVRFAPTSGGLKTASLSIPNNDGDENPFVIHLTGTGTIPLSTNADMASLSVTEGNIFGPMLQLDPPFSPAITHYQVEISQESTAVSLTGLVADPSATIYAIGNMGTFGSLNVTYGFGAGDPASYSFTVMAQDGFTFKTYTINFVRRVVPEIAIEQAGSDITIGATQVFEPAVVGTTADLTFTILNTGNADLTLSGSPMVSVTGSPNFTVTAQPASPITGPSGSSNFTVRFTPTGSGLKTAALSIPNNDGDENPFVINLTGTATIPLSTNADMGSLSVTEGSISGPILALDPAFSPAITHYQVEILQDTTAVNINGLVADPSATISAMGNMGTFGSLNVTHSFFGGLNPYSFNVMAQDGFTFKTYTINFVRSTASEIAIEQASSNIANGATKTFGPAVAGTTSDLVFTILNTGTADLTLTGTPKVAVSGSPDFTVTAQPASPITGPSGSSNFTVRFTPTGSGLKSASLSIANNDDDENPFVINLTGTATAALVLMPNGDFASGSTGWTEGGLINSFSYPASGGNPGGYGIMNALPGQSGYWVGNNNAAISIASLGLTAGNCYTFSQDMRIEGGIGTNIGGLKVEFIPSGTTGEMRIPLIGNGSTWETYHFNILIPVGTTGIKIVPLWGVSSNVGFDNFTVNSTPTNPPQMGIPNPGFGIPTASGWERSGPLTGFTYPTSGGNPGGFSVMDASNGEWGVFVSNNSVILPLAALSLSVGQTYNFTQDMKVLSGTNVGGLKVEFYNGTTTIGDTGNVYQPKIGDGSTWETYTFTLSIPPNTTGIKIVPIWGPNSSVGFDNFAVMPAPPAAPPQATIAPATKVNWTPTNMFNSYQPQKSFDNVVYTIIGPAIVGTAVNSVFDAGEAPFYRVTESLPGTQEAIYNGGFTEEEFFSSTSALGWQSVEVQPSTRLETGGRGDNGPCMQIKVPNVAGGLDSEIQQNTKNATGGTVSAGQTYNFSFWAKQISSAGAYEQRYKVSFLDDIGYIITEGSFQDFSGTIGVWKEFTLNGLVVPTNATSALIQILGVTGTTAGDAGEVLIDDVSLSVPSSDPPTLLATTTAPAVGISWPSTTGKSVKVQSSLNLANWEDFGAEVPGNDTIQTVFDAIVAPKKFWRIGELP